jgi:tRNA(Ile)-lysidine synthase
VALLCALATLGRSPNLGIAHFNHGLRGEESDADEEFVRQLHAQLAADGSVGATFHCFRADTARTARLEKGNLEAVARRVRYDWLARIAVESGAPWIATGHTTEDQAETVLHRLMRGTGLKGLRGIAARRRLVNNVELIRPMLTLSRTDVLSYLEDIGQPYRTDSSNRDPRFTRNRIRHELLPLLKQEFNPNIVAVLSHLARQADDAYQLELEQARALLAATEQPRAGSQLIFDRRPLAAAPRPVVRAFFRLVWEREGWPMGRLGFAAWDRLAGVVFAETGGADLPGNIRVRGKERVVQIWGPV